MNLKKGNIFVVEFPEEFNIQDSSIAKVDKPKFVNGKWGKIKVEFIDSIKTSKSLYELILIYNKILLFDINIKILDVTNEILEEWVINVSDISVIDFGSLDLENNIKPFIIIKPLKCTLIGS